jgi:hypothetical protein
MDSNSRTDQLPPYPTQAPRRDTQAPGRRTFYAVVLGAVAFVAVVSVAGVLSVGLLKAFDPMGDEWICSEGETPAGMDGFYNQCFKDGATLPAGYHRDPFGNRPMPYNCEKDGWVQIARPAKDGEVVQDCVRADTDLPGRWHLVES